MIIVDLPLVDHPAIFWNAFCEWGAADLRLAWYDTIPAHLGFEDFIIWC